MANNVIERVRRRLGRAHHMIGASIHAVQDNEFVLDLLTQSLEEVSLVQALLQGVEVVEGYINPERTPAGTYVHTAEPWGDEEVFALLIIPDKEMDGE